MELIDIYDRRTGADHSWNDANPELRLLQTVDQPLQVPRAKGDHR